ncbi:replication initiation protein [Marinomonas algarum]|uniref:Replication initiation protein n=1 Tax=Marinomonas algarum TaxID=2883105 RepID=A0A9X1LF56_9GAMM|nr:replication initiation protein [Marinomonas algarum]MCB5162641.1 replication initiation protein [Marinomonas algarum]
MNENEVLEGTLERSGQEIEIDGVRNVTTELAIKNDLVIYKDNALVWGRFDLSKVELKIVNALIALINPLEPFKKQNEWNFTKADLEDLGVSSIGNLHRHIDEITTNLQSQIIRLPMKDKDGKQIDDGKSFEKVNLFYKSKWDDKKKIASFSFHPELEPYLINLKGHFTKYHLHHVQRMESQYGIRLYELLRSIYSLEKVKKGSFSISLPLSYDKLREVLELGDKYPRFSNFHTRVLQPAVDDLNTTDIDVKYSFPDRLTPKSTAKVKTIVFTITTKFGYHPTKTVKGSTIAVEDENEVRLSIKRQLNLFFTSSASDKLISNYGVTRCLSNMKLLADEDSATKINNAAGWLRKAIEEDYANSDLGINLVNLLKVSTETDIHKRRFLDEQLIPIWPSLESEEQRDFLQHRFDQGAVAVRFAQYYAASLSGNIPAPAVQVKTVNAKADRNAVNAELNNLLDTDWAFD